MSISKQLTDLLDRELAASEFQPYLDLSEDGDALNFYFRPDADYSKRLTDHVTLFLSLDKHEIVGCRIKGIRGILEDLPNYVQVSHEGIKLSVIFWSFRGGVEDEEVRRAFNVLGRAASALTIELA
ncbi:MAG: hypothetical protein KF708_13585 [Pirellulales bacterium]|nr:hypothetical protein [Pirellulales bacterium]